jgi:hypothetical protein
VLQGLESVAPNNRGITKRVTKKKEVMNIYIDLIIAFAKPSSFAKAVNA